MSFFVEDKSSFESTPPGAHLARCYRIVDLGTQKSEYMGQVKFLHKITINWEILSKDEDGQPIRMKDGRPFSIYKNYTMSWAEMSNLRKDLQRWRGKPFTQEELRRFDLKTVLGAYCMLNVIERQGSDGKMYTNVETVSPVPAMIKQLGLPPAVNKDTIFNLSEPDMELFETFHDSLKTKIKSSPEGQKLFGGVAPAASGNASTHSDAGVEDDDIPF